METMKIAAKVAAKVAMRQGMKISTGFEACIEALAAMTATGIILKPEACRLKNMICAFEADDLFGFNSCKLSIVFKPNGVAALSRPRRFAEKFIIIWPNTGCPFGTSGKSRVKNGPIILDRILIPPALSAIFINPRNNAITPISFRAILTDDQQVSMMPSVLVRFEGSSAFPTTIQPNISEFPKTKHLNEATAIATMINTLQILLSAIYLCITHLEKFGLPDFRTKRRFFKYS